QRKPDHRACEHQRSRYAQLRGSIDTAERGVGVAAGTGYTLAVPLLSEHRGRAETARGFRAGESTDHCDGAGHERKDRAKEFWLASGELSREESTERIERNDADFEGYGDHGRYPLQ